MPVSTALEHISRRLHSYDEYSSHALQDMDLHIADVYGALLRLFYDIRKSLRRGGKLAAFIKVAASRYSTGSELKKAVDEFDSAQDRLEAELRRQYDSSSESDDEWARSELDKLRKIGTWPRREERRKTCLTSGLLVLPASGSMAY
ncbi:uncharacterized protein ARMOST_19522 [Armillaria ostoyae]|uniref:Uncharacterized protein n=1 Tax=Armillaria ostoyae TaxID=47428 RepID=A0A284S4R8_ARMOS|nr:uncharacterized protein ARMOST_19522 [Armillaria ostoyae]